MMKKRRWFRMIATTMSLTLAMSACQSTTTARADHGGTLTIAAWEPDCADPLLPCSSNAWGGAFSTMTSQTVPRVFDSRDGHYYVPSPLLAGAPTLSVGPPQTVTYHLNRKAKWSDGQPITSSDFRFTWQSVIHEKDVIDPTGYDQINNIDDSDPATAVVTFTSPYADWRDLFGPLYGVLPQHLLANRDRHTAMKDGYGWSGGPWLIQSWTKGQSVVLVPNRHYWGERPKLDRVVFRFITDNSAEEQAYRTGQVQVIAPIGRSSRADLRTLPNTNFSITPGNNFEVLMFNTAQPPLDDKAVRQALAYATDRSAIAKSVFGLAAQYEPLDSFLSPVNPDYVTPFGRYQRNLQKVDDIMQVDGWSRGPDGIWTAAGTAGGRQLHHHGSFSARARRGRREHAQDPVAGSRIRRHRQTELQRRLLRRHPAERQVLNRQLLPVEPVVRSCRLHRLVLREHSPGRAGVKLFRASGAKPSTTCITRSL